MKIEIWSDVMCPFCYIGKRKFETALSQFPHREKLQIEWKSYQLMPDLETGAPGSMEQILAEKKGIDPDQARAMNNQVTQVARQVGLEFNFEKAIPANTFKAHRFAHFAKVAGKQPEAEEALFQAYFTDGKNIDDTDTLLQLGKQIGLDNATLKSALENGDYREEVRNDIYEANRLGARGVPFFVFDRKQAVSGAQDPSVFLKVLEATFPEWQKNNPEIKLDVIEGPSCTPDGECQ